MWLLFAIYDILLGFLNVFAINFNCLGDADYYKDLEGLGSPAEIIKLQHKYENDIVKSEYNISDMKNIGEFNASAIRLYNLDYDPSESNDLFTDNNGRFRYVARKLYDILREKAATQMVNLVLYGHSETEGKYRNSIDSFEEIRLDNGEKVKKWYPWLDDKTAD